MATGLPSETLKGIGMGAETPGGFNAGIHTSTGVTFQLAAIPQSVPTSPSSPTVPALAHPIADPAKRIISQPFGADGHTGIDYAVATSTPIGAADAGVVQESGFDDGGYGEYIKVRHAWGESVYAHLKTRRVEAGEPVNRGNVIGNSGNTGNSTGPHLHFAMRVNPYNRADGRDGFSDPAPYLTSPTTDAPTQRLGQREIVKLICTAALEFGVDPDLLLSQAWAESSFRPDAVSGAGAQGLLQIMPATWAEWSPKIGAGNDPYDAQQNARVGAAYLKWLLSQTKGNAYDALAAYGWGIGNWLGDDPVPPLWVGYANKIVHGRDLLKAVGA